MMMMRKKNKKATLYSQKRHRHTIYLSLQALDLRMSCPRLIDRCRRTRDSHERMRLLILILLVIIFFIFFHLFLVTFHLAADLFSCLLCSLRCTCPLTCPLLQSPHHALSGGTRRGEALLPLSPPYQRLSSFPSLLLLLFRLIHELVAG